jgi:hypothetical protein
MLYKHSMNRKPSFITSSALFAAPTLHSDPLAMNLLCIEMEFPLALTLTAMVSKESTFSDVTASS